MTPMANMAMRFLVASQIHRIYHVVLSIPQILSRGRTYIPRDLTAKSALVWSTISARLVVSSSQVSAVNLCPRLFYVVPVMTHFSGDPTYTYSDRREPH